MDWFWLLFLIVQGQKRKVWWGNRSRDQQEDIKQQQWAKDKYVAQQ
jgi:hypothetical protein